MIKLRCFLSRWAFRLGAWLAPEIELKFTESNDSKEGVSVSFDGGPKFQVKSIKP